jgi:hypothetical protein
VRKGEWAIGWGQVVACCEIISTMMSAAEATSTLRSPPHACSFQRAMRNYQIHVDAGIHTFLRPSIGVV